MISENRLRFQSVSDSANAIQTDPKGKWPMSGVGAVVVEGKGEQGVVGEDSDVDAEEGVGGREAAAGE
ncbi:uncharacterized protein A4U43_C04F850 [Asparagus officinalis]|uniref:Uncharacterized protein n=1 Tax=Asparagus officinalis TaxID=4686 RepID=A0A5P1EZ33_ASPOF|nr:uncharacterized protein A4U43_C04F850 [Asparagus officinalis]